MVAKCALEIRLKNKIAIRSIALLIVNGMTGHHGQIARRVVAEVKKSVAETKPSRQLTEEYLVWVV